MGLKLSGPISMARVLLNDTRTPYRYSDSDLLAYANEAIKSIIELAPQYFYTEGELECIPDQCLQSIPFDNARSLVDVIGLVGGSNIYPANEDSLSAFKPSWQLDAAAPAINWFPMRDDPVRFYVYPKAPSGQKISVLYVRIPDDFTDTQETNLPPTLALAVTDFVVFRAESRNDESVNSNRASQFYQSFLGRFQGGK